MKEIERVTPNNDCKPEPPPRSRLDEALDCIWGTPSDTTTADEPGLRSYSKEFVKAVPLFLRGKAGLYGSAGVFALDQMHGTDGALTQVVDGVVGASKGAALKSIFDAIGGSRFDFSTKGALMGFSSRGIETLFDKKTIVSPLRGVNAALEATFDRRAAGADLAIFGLSHSASGWLGKTSFQGLMRSRLGGTVLTGTVFGASTGAYQEFCNQARTGELDFLAVGKSSLIHAGITGGASFFGGLQHSISFHKADFGPMNIEQTKANYARLSNPLETILPVDSPLEGKLKFEDTHDFMVRGVKQVDRPMVQYDIAGHQAQLLVPKQYDILLKDLRATRDVAARPLFGNGISSALGVAKARISLDVNPIKGQYLPEDLITGLDRLPDRLLVERVIALNERPAVDSYGPTHKSVQAEVRNKDFWFFKNEPGWDPTSVVTHEWGHLWHRADPAAFEAFKHASVNERLADPNKSYGLYQHDPGGHLNKMESWATSTEALLGDSDVAFDRLVRRAPFRVAVLGQSLERILSNSDSTSQNPMYETYTNRLKVINETVRPEAIADLSKVVHNGGEGLIPALAVLEFLGAKGRPSQPVESPVSQESGEPLFARARKGGMSSADFLASLMQKADARRSKSGATMPEMERETEAKPEKKPEPEKKPVEEPTILSEGVHEVSSGKYTVSGKTRVKASGTAQIFASGDAIVESSGDSRVSVDGNATVIASERSQISVKGKASAQIKGYVTCFAFGEAQIKASGYCRVTAGENSRVEASGKVEVNATQNATVIGSKNSKINASDAVKVEARGETKVNAAGKGVSVKGFDKSIIEIQDGAVEATGSAHITASGDARVKVLGSAVVYSSGTTKVELSESAEVHAMESTRITARDHAMVSMTGNSTAEVFDHVIVGASGESRVKAVGNANVILGGKAFAVVGENAHAVANENAKVEALDDASVKLWGSTSVTARNRAKVVANDQSSVELFDNAHADATSLATINKHDAATVTIGGEARLHVPTMIYGQPSAPGIYTEDSPMGRLYQVAKEQVVQLRASPSSAYHNYGTGFFIAKDGLLATAFHVVDGARGPIDVIFQNGTKGKADVVAHDAAADIALLKMHHPIDLKTGIPELAAGAGRTSGDVIAAGFPNATKVMQMSPGSLAAMTTLSAGLGAAMKPRPSQAVLDHPRLVSSSFTQPGNSGGPIYSADGRYILGVTTQSDVATTMAATADTILRLKAQLK